MAYSLRSTFLRTAAKTSKALITILILFFASSVACGCAREEPNINMELKQHRFERAKSILEKNPKLIDARGPQDWTPLHQAVQRFDYDTESAFEFLIANGADVNAKDKRGRTALHMTVKCGRKKMVEVLIANGAAVNPREYRGRTPLDIALLYNRHDLAELLRKHGGHE